MEQIKIDPVEATSGGKRLKGGGKTALLIALGVLAVSACTYLGLCAYASHTDKIYPGRSVRGIDLGGLTTLEASQKLEQEFPLQRFQLTVRHQDRDGTEILPISYEDLGATLNYDMAARTLNREFEDPSFFRSGWDFLLSLIGKHKLDTCTLDINDSTFRSGCDQLISQLTGDPKDAFYTLDESGFYVTTAVDGASLPEEDGLSFPDRLRDALRLSDGMEVTLGVQDAQELTAQALHDELCGEMKNAGYDPETKTVTPEKVGLNFDPVEVQALLDAAEPGETVKIPAQVDLPKVDAENLEKVLFRDLLGECTTNVGGSAARKSNVQLAAKALDGKVLNDGEVFSYNAVVGQRTAARGYQAAPAYVKGETVNEIGGGVCQPSSTLYLACLRSDLQITERTAHRYVPAYIPAGMDATVSWGGPDFKFTNNSGYPLQIRTFYRKNRLTIQIWGTNADGITAKVTNQQLSTTPFEVVYEEDAKMAPGTEVVKTTPYTGSKWQTYRHRYDSNGQLVSSEFEASSNYQARNKVIVRGPVVETPPAVNPSTPEKPKPQPKPEPPQPKPEPIVPEPVPEPTPEPAPEPAPEPEPLPQEPDFSIIPEG